MTSNVIGTGHHSTVVHPSQKCNNPLIESSKDYVSKILDEDFYNKEIKINEELRNIEGLSEYLLLLEDDKICHDTVRDGQLYKKNLIYKYGGISLGRHIEIKKINTSANLLTKLFNLIQALIILCQNDLMHGDLHKNNLVIDVTDDINIKIIDFDKTSNIIELEQNWETSSYSSYYSYWYSIDTKYEFNLFIYLYDFMMLSAIIYEILHTPQIYDSSLTVEQVKYLSENIETFKIGREYSVKQEIDNTINIIEHYKISSKEDIIKVLDLIHNSFINVIESTPDELKEIIREHRVYGGKKRLKKRLKKRKKITKKIYKKTKRQTKRKT